MSITQNIPARPPNDGRSAGPPTWGGWLLAGRILLLADVSFAAGMYVGMRHQAGREQELNAAAAQRALIALADNPGGRETAGWERRDDLRAGGAIHLITAGEGVQSETWTVCLARKQFWFRVTRGVHTWRLSGRFEKAGGGWHAVVVDESRAFHPLKR